MIGFDMTVKSLEKFDGMIKDYSDALNKTIAEMKDHKDDKEAVINDLKKISTIGANFEVIGYDVTEGAAAYIRLLNEEKDA